MVSNLIVNKCIYNKNPVETNMNFVNQNIGNIIYNFEKPKNKDLQMG